MSSPDAVDLGGKRKVEAGGQEPQSLFGRLERVKFAHKVHHAKAPPAIN